MFKLGFSVGYPDYSVEDINWVLDGIGPNRVNNPGFRPESKTESDDIRQTHGSVPF